MAEAKRRLAAIMAADVAGYSSLMGDDEQATLDTLNSYRDVFRARVSDRHGRIVDTAGDSVLAVFDSAVEAVKAAASVQMEIAERNTELVEARRMRFRIGINLGDVIEQDDGTLYGDGVNVAARLEALAEPGSMCVSGKVFEEVDGKSELGFEDIGAHTVKNIVRPVRAYRVIVDQQIVSVASSEAPPISERPSIAVLAFENLSGDPEQEYFADGIAEDLITELSRLRWLQVMARNSSFSYKGHSPDIRDVGRDLGARYVVEGSVRKGGERIRITAQLIGTTDGNHIWAQRYDREITDIFLVQDEITATIAGAIEPELGDAERDRALAKHPSNLDAWDCYQRGLWHFYRYQTNDNNEARQLFLRATELDPRFALAHAGLALTYIMAGMNDFTPEELDKDNAIYSAQKAIEADEKDPMAHYAMGRAYQYAANVSAAIAEQEIAIQLNPNFALAHYGLGFALTVNGEPQRSLASLDLAERLSPRDINQWAVETVRAAAFIQLGDFDQAVEQARRALRHPTPSFWPYAILTSALGHTGANSEAASALSELLAVKPDFSVAIAERVLKYRHDKNFEEIAQGLRKAGLAIGDRTTTTE